MGVWLIGQNNVAKKHSAEEGVFVQKEFRRQRAFAIREEAED